MSRIGFKKRETWLIVGLFGLMVAIIAIKNLNLNKDNGLLPDNKEYGAFNVFIRNVTDSSMLFVPPGHFNIDSVAIERILGSKTGTKMSFFCNMNSEVMSLTIIIGDYMEDFIEDKYLKVNVVDSLATPFIGVGPQDSTIKMTIEYLFRQSVNLGLRNEVPLLNNRLEMTVNRFDSLASMEIFVKGQSCQWQNPFYGGLYMISASFTFDNVRIGKRIVN